MIIPYLTFAGDCEEAMELYQKVFGGERGYASRYTVQTGGEALAGKIMHTEITVGGSVIAAADQETASPNDCVKLMVHFDNAEDATRAFSALAEGGAALQRLTPHPPPDDGGMGALVRDKYGYTWILTAPNPAKI